jgi:hypothetical protein
MNHRQIKLLQDNDHCDWYYYWDYENEIFFDYEDYYISYTTKNGLVDWSDEIPLAVKRSNLIDKILKNSSDNQCNSLENYWPNKI